MDIRELKNGIKNNNRFYFTELKEVVIINEIEKKNGRIWGIGTTEDGKETRRIDIRFLESIKDKVDINPPTPFPEENREELEKREERVFEALRLLGRNRGHIREKMRPEMENAMRKTMMVKYSHLLEKEGTARRDATVRTMHYANTSLVALQIARGIFPNDEELARGIQVCALGHDYGQCTFGHDGEEAARKSLENYNAGSVSHNVQGALIFLHRLYPELVSAINEEPIIKEEAKKRLNQEDVLDKQDYFRKLKKIKDEIRQNLELRLEPEVQEKIRLETIKNEDIIDEAIELLILSAGNHNGERGTAQIEPDYSRTFEDFMKIIQETGIDSKANNKLVPHTIADSIAKLADQISSIPFDMIDGVRSGIEDEISSKWVTPVSKILQITENEARERLNGNNKELVTLAFELQDKLIESVIRCSNSRKINMDLDELLYGLNDTIGLRTPNLPEHIIYTSTEEEEILLDNLFADLTDKLSEQILDERGLFNPELNALFRLKANNPTRKNEETNLRSKYSGPEAIRDFYDYCVDITADEYNFHKKTIKKKEIEYFRELIEKELELDGDKVYTLPRIPERGTMEYAIKIAMMSGIEKVSKDENGKYSDEKIKKMMSNINAFLRNKPIDGIDNLNVTAPRTTYYPGKKKQIEERKVTDDQSIAARIAVSYLCQLNDTDLLKLGQELGFLTDEQIKVFKIPYTEYSPKRQGKQGHYGGATERTVADYNHGINTCNNINKEER